MDTKTPQETPPAGTPGTTTPPESTIPPTTPPSDPSVPPTVPPAVPPAKAPFKLSKKMLLIIGGVVLLIIVVILGVVFAGSSKKAQDNTKTPTPSGTTSKGVDTIHTTPTPPKEKALTQTMVYGAWTGQTSAIKAVNLATSETTLLASLPIEVKKVNILSPKSLLYIDQTDTQDHGKRISIYSIKDKLITTSIPAADGFSIDDYVLSANKKYLAIWEVKFAPGLSVLEGGQSRVYSVDLTNPTVTTLLYDESSAPTVINGPTLPVHYPRAILNDGTVFADTFIPNDTNGGAGWAYGMSKVDVDGTNKIDLDTMKMGTYGTQPSLSPDGKYLLFSGYDGSRGDGNAVKNGYRQALLTPNTVDVVNTQTLQRFTLPNLPNTNTYTSAAWDTATGKVLVTIISPEAAKTGTYLYDLSAKTLTLIKPPTSNGTTYGFISELAKNVQLIGSQDENPSNLGNLGESYSYAYTQFALLDVSTAKVSYVSTEDTYPQYITILPPNYFKGVLGASTKAQASSVEPQPTFIDLYSNQNDPKQRLQLYTFFLKNDLLETRLTQQSKPHTPIPSIDLSKITVPPLDHITPAAGIPDNLPNCNDITAKQCAEQGHGPGTPEYLTCKGDYKAQNMLKTCSDSPLYLYGKSGQSVQVTIQTPVTNAVPQYTNGYNVMMLADGKMQINNNMYERISYDYLSNLRKITRPTQGTVTSQSNAINVLKSYAAKLGLNAKETSDLVQAGRQKITTPYAFISYFDHNTSQQMLPIKFNPQPDNYLNVVVYFKLLQDKPNFTPVPPSFPKPINRSGFTAVEVSEMVE